MDPEKDRYQKGEIWKCIKENLTQNRSQETRKGPILMLMALVTACKIQQEEGRVPLRWKQQDALPCSCEGPPPLQLPVTNEKLPPPNSSFSNELLFKTAPPNLLLFSMKRHFFPLFSGLVYGLPQFACSELQFFCLSQIN